ncbi:MAG: hypothetical protein WKF94_11645 [Solirubrobacteraceae bacterium]
MHRHSLLLTIVLLAITTLAAPATAHVGSTEPSAVGPRAAVVPNSDPFTVGPNAPQVVQGPCTDASATKQYADGEQHDHLDIASHRAACQMEQQAFLPLKDELASDPGTQDDEVLGEMDVEGDVAAVAIAYPRAGILFFDVSDPTAPKFMRRYNGPGCEGTAIDVDCGAFVDLSKDGKTAFLSVQQISVIPGINPGGLADPARPGVQVVDVASGTLAFEQPIASVGGVHTSRDHIVPEGPSSPEQGRAPGHYLFSVANGMGIEISEVIETPVGQGLLDVGLIEIDEVHDMFIQDDPLTGRTYMYVAAGFDTGFLVYDVTDPAAAVGGNRQLVAEWDLTPECREDWYSHTIDVAIRNNRRYVTMPAEAFVLGDQSDEDQAKGCGKTAGNGDKASPLWIVDATDFGALGRDGYADALDGDGVDTAAEVKAASEKALVTTWTNAAARPAQNINFTPHNQQIVGDRIYLSGYHSGVTALDASGAFAGRNERPNEIGFIVPAGTPTRPIYSQAVDPAVPFFTAFIGFRPLIWDMVAYKGSVLAADMTGGFYSFSQPAAVVATEDGEPIVATEDGEPIVATEDGEPIAEPTPCRTRPGAIRARVRPTPGGGLRLALRRASRPVTVRLLRHSRGRRVTGTRVVQRLRPESTALQAGTSRLPDGFYSVVIRDDRGASLRIALRRTGGRFAQRPRFARQDGCGLIRSFKLNRPVFGGSQQRSLGVAYRLKGAGRVRVTVADARRRVVRRFAVQRVGAGRVGRLRIPSRGIKPGDYQVKLSVVGPGRRAAAKLTARRL